MKRVLIDFSSQLDIIWSMKKRESGEELYIPLENKFHSLFAKATSRSPFSMARSVVRIFSDFPPVVLIFYSAFSHHWSVDMKTVWI